MLSRGTMCSRVRLCFSGWSSTSTYPNTQLATKYGRKRYSTVGGKEGGSEGGGREGGGREGGGKGEGGGRQDTL